MNLKEMHNTVVIIKSIEEALEYQSICEEGGWLNGGFHDDMRGYSYPTARMAAWDANGRLRGNDGYSEITLAEFKKEQGIMKYKAGDVLVSRTSNEKKVQGVCGEIYFMSHSNNFSKHECGYTDAELKEKGWSLKADTPITELTLEDVAKLKGIPVEQLRIKD